MPMSCAVAFPKTTGASRYTVTAVLRDGRKLGFELAGSAAQCGSRTCPPASRDREGRGRCSDPRTGAYRTITLAAKRTSAGARGAPPKHVCH
jgi:hypothetical protein